jgi:hypothetical protein
MVIDSECIVTYKLFNGTSKVIPVTTESNKLEIALIDTFIPILKCKSNNCVKIMIKNTSGTDLHSIIVKDYLTPHEKYIPNTLTIDDVTVKHKDPAKGISIDRINNNSIVCVSYKISNPSPNIANCLVSYKYNNQKKIENFSLINN